MSIARDRLPMMKADTEQVSFLEEIYVAWCKNMFEQPSREEFI
jgi:hypothetical protein